MFSFSSVRGLPIFYFMLPKPACSVLLSQWKPQMEHGRGGPKLRQARPIGPDDPVEVEITVVAARELRGVGADPAQCCAVVELTLGSEVVRTSAVQGTLSPEFHSVFRVRFPSPDVLPDSLQVFVCHSVCVGVCPYACARVCLY